MTKSTSAHNTKINSYTGYKNKTTFLALEVSKTIFWSWLLSPSFSDDEMTSKKWKPLLGLTQWAPPILKIMSVRQPTAFCKRYSAAIINCSSVLTFHPPRVLPNQKWNCGHSRFPKCTLFTQPNCQYKTPVCAYVSTSTILKKLWQYKVLRFHTKTDVPLYTRGI